mgnify:CR=1 FL=1
MALSQREHGNPRDAFAQKCGHRRRLLGRDGAQGSPDRVGLFDESLRGFEDPDLWMRLAAVSGYACIDETLAVILRREQSVSRNLDSMRVAALRSMRKNRALLTAVAAARPLLAQLPCRRLYRLCQTRVPGGAGSASPTPTRCARADAVSSGPRTAVPRLLRDFLLRKPVSIVRPLDTLVLGSLANGTGRGTAGGRDLLAVALVLKSVRDFTRTGPEMADEVLRHYRPLSRMSRSRRLVVFALLITASMAFVGVVGEIVAVILLGIGYHPIAASSPRGCWPFCCSPRAASHTRCCSPRA